MSEIASIISKIDVDKLSPEIIGAISKVETQNSATARAYIVLTIICKSLVAVAKYLVISQLLIRLGISLLP